MKPTEPVDLIECHGAENLIYGALMGANEIDNEPAEICYKANHQNLPDTGSTLKLEFDPKQVFVFKKIMVKD